MDEFPWQLKGRQNQLCWGGKELEARAALAKQVTSARGLEG